MVELHQDVVAGRMYEYRRLLAERQRRHMHEKLNLIHSSADSLQSVTQVNKQESAPGGNSLGHELQDSPLSPQLHKQDIHSSYRTHHRHHINMAGYNKVRALASKNDCCRQILHTCNTGPSSSDASATTPAWFIACDLMVYPVQHVRKLRWVVDELKNVLDVYKRFRDQIDIGDSLRKKFDCAMSALDFLSINLYQAERKELKKQLRKTPDFQEDYDYNRKDANGEAGSTLRWTHGYDSVDGAYFRLKPLHSALLKLTKNPENTDSIAPAWLTNFIDDHLAGSNNKERSKIDQTLYDHFARMTCYYELVSAVRLHRPCPRAMSYDRITPEEMRRPTWKLWRKPTGNMTEQETLELANLLRTLRKTPWPAGKQDQAWLDTASETDIEEYVEPFSADQSADYQAELNAERAAAEKIIAEIRAKKQNMPAIHAVSQSVWGDGVSDKFDPAPEKTKPKTGPDGSTVNANTTAVDLADLQLEDEASAPRIAVNGESMRIVARMFPISAGDVSKVLVKWHTLRSGRDTTVGSIAFHKPHPDPNVDPIMLQTMRKRMRKWFGWDRKSFMETEK
ncbi:hypothetical protein DOTSEDRAFT_31417 [Dothistroma septosporum NZE10]|uniref:Uncharacterized protein n=1 Tax=Dothistroma septosporum (strain NZE10 / CBS 128990) TaxID=675120 RepID=N1Q5B6_DOTSN|nr:hypothetical protein DOTSEDRAFT_31417 [Dothistroma septosporum NZE10]